MGLGAHFRHDRRDLRWLQGGEPHVAAAHDLEGDRRGEETHRRTHARGGRHQHGVQRQLLRDARGVQRRRAAEGDQRSAGHVLAPFGGVGAGRRRHVLVHDFAHGPGGLVHRQFGALPRRNDVAFDCVLRGIDVQRNGAASEALRMQTLLQQIRVCHGGVRTAVAIAGGAGRRTRAARAYLQAAHAIDRRNRAAACPDLHHFDHRDAHRQAAALAKPIAASHLERARFLGHAVVD